MNLPTRCPLVLIALLSLAILHGCGGGGGGSGGRQDDPPLELGPAPEIALVFCSGHDFAGTPVYLATSAAVAVESALLGAGIAFETFHFADAIGTGSDAGYTDLVALLRAIRDEWIAEGTRVVLIAHSHGSVRTHAALRAVPDCAVRLLVDLDGSSNGFGLVHAGGEAATMGGGPVDAYDLGVDLGCAAYPAVPDESGTVYDLEDVVLPNAEEAFEVRSGEVSPNPFQSEPYDERLNARTDGTQTGLACLWSDTSHSEVHDPGGSTMATVTAWILERLAADAP